jgi:hypothetical protein
MSRLPGASLLIAALVPATAAFAGSEASIGRNEGRPATAIEDTVDVQHVMDAFHDAVVTHNGSRLAALFIPEGSMWLNVLSDDAYVRAKAKSPEAAKIRLGSYKAFAEFVASSKASLDPRHSHVQIRSDSTIASVYFDFAFLINGKEENHGSETWQLVKGAEGWRIAAITYSSDPHAPSE